MRIVAVAASAGQRYERDQPHMKRVELEEVLEAEERLNEQGNTSVRQQWDFEQQH